MRWILPGGAELGGSKHGDDARRVACRPLAAVQESGITTIKVGGVKASYATYTNKKIKGSSIPLKNYVQQDEHSCAFVAALTVARHFMPSISAKNVLVAVRPLVSAGVDRRGLVKALNKLDIKAEYRDDLTVGKLRKYVEQGVPVIVSIWPDEWDTDHWTVVQGFDDDRVYLTNHRSLTKADFRKQWIENWEDGNTRGAGLVCEPITTKTTDTKLSIERPDDPDDDRRVACRPGGAVLVRTRQRKSCWQRKWWWYSTALSHYYFHHVANFWELHEAGQSPEGFDPNLRLGRCQCKACRAALLAGWKPGSNPAPQR